MARVLTQKREVNGFLERMGVELHVMIVLGMKLGEGPTPSVQFDVVTWGIRSCYEQAFTWDQMERWYRGHISACLL